MGSMSTMSRKLAIEQLRKCDEYLQKVYDNIRDPRSVVYCQRCELYAPPSLMNGSVTHPTQTAKGRVPCASGHLYLAARDHALRDPIYRRARVLLGIGYSFRYMCHEDLDAVEEEENDW